MLIAAQRVHHGSLLTLEDDMRKPGTKRSWLALVVAIGGLGAALLAKPEPAYALTTCIDSAGNACCYVCATGAQTSCGPDVCVFPNHRWPDSF